jgi:hypothetical protein
MPLGSLSAEITSLEFYASSIRPPLTVVDSRPLSEAALHISAKQLVTVKSFTIFFSVEKDS